MCVNKYVIIQWLVSLVTTIVVIACWPHIDNQWLRAFTIIASSGALSVMWLVTILITLEAQS
jgi:hypothetical protein